MEYALTILGQAIKNLEKEIRENNLMQVNMSEATLKLKQISEIKKAVKVLQLKLNQKLKSV
jgi:hypothetical protein